MNKLITLILAVVVAAFTWAAPAASASPEPVYKLDTKVKPAKPYKIAVVLKNFTNPFWLTHQKAAERAGKDLGVSITVLAPTKPDNVEEQVRILEDLISKKVDAVVVAPANTQAIAAGVQKLNAAKIPVVYDNTRGSGGDFVAYIGADNILVGRTMAEEMVKRMGGKGKLLVLEGMPGQQTADDRLKGVKEVLAKNPGIEYHLPDRQVDPRRGSKRHRKHVAALARPQSHPVHWRRNGPGRRGSREGCRQGRQDHHLQHGCQSGTGDAVKAGKVNFTVSQAPGDQAYWSVVAAIRCSERRKGASGNSNACDHRHQGERGQIRGGVIFCLSPCCRWREDRERFRSLSAAGDIPQSVCEY